MRRVLRERDDSEGSEGPIVYRTYRPWYRIYAVIFLAFFLGSVSSHSLRWGGRGSDSV